MIKPGKFITKMCGIILILWMTPGLASALPAGDARVLTSQKNQVYAPANLGQMKWLVGEWEGILDGAQQQHMMFTPVAGHMPGFVRAWSDDGTILFYELFVLVEVDGTLETRVKHFTPELAGWEGKDEYVGRRLIKIVDNAFFFDGITFVRENEAEHTVYYRIPYGERTGEILVVRQKRIITGKKT